MSPKTEVEPVPSNDDIRFAAGVKHRREMLGWSQGELARLLKAAGLTGFHQTTISRIEKCDRLVRLGEANVIARTLQTRLDVMFLDAGEMETLVDFTDAVKGRGRNTHAITQAVHDFLFTQDVVKQSMDSMRRMRDEEETVVQKFHLASLIADGKTLLALNPVAIAEKAVEDYRGKHPEEA